MSDALRRLIEAMGKLFIGIFAKRKMTPLPAPPPSVTIPPIPAPIPPAPPPTIIEGAGAIAHAAVIHPAGPQSPWWLGRYPYSQDYGCTDLALEAFNPRHPECRHHHEGQDIALPCGVPIYAGRKLTVKAIDPKLPNGQFAYGPAALRLNVFEGVINPDIWLLHMQDYAVHVGQVLQRGELLGHVGRRGLATGCHLHFEVRPGGAGPGASINPARWLGFSYG